MEQNSTKNMKQYHLKDNSVTSTRADRQNASDVWTPSDSFNIQTMTPSSDAAGDNIGCINGIRFLSLTWVILGHAYSFVPYVMSNALYAFGQVPKRVSMQVSAVLGGNV